MIHKSFNCNLNQLTSFSRGVLSDANSDGLFDTVASSSRTQAWNLDALGNWSNLSTNSTSQSRTHNAQNQVTGVDSTSLTYEANGSMTADESSRVFVYDAWNRLAAVRNSSNSPIVTYSIDALGRRITEDRPNANTVDHLYYSTGWQVLEERRGGTSSGDIRRQYFWSIDYVDALTARVDYASGAVSATYHAQYDANWNITAIADATSGIVERYTYDPYGVVTVLYANWSVRGGSPYGWNYLHQGGRFDVDSNLYNFRHRDYSATLGRWTQTDPIGFEAGDVNFYRYVGNSPGNGLDPSGLDRYIGDPLTGLHTGLAVDIWELDPKTGQYCVVGQRSFDFGPILVTLGLLSPFTRGYITERGGNQVPIDRRIRIPSNWYEDKKFLILMEQDQSNPPSYSLLAHNCKNYSMRASFYGIEYRTIKRPGIMPKGKITETTMDSPKLNTPRKAPTHIQAPRP